MARTARLSVEIDGRGARRGASGVSSELNRLKGEARGVSREFEALGRAAQAAFAYFGLRELKRYADEATNVRSRLNALSNSTAELGRHQQEVSRLAQETRSELGATSVLYATMTRTGQDLGLAQSEIARITETVNKSFAITGTDGNTASQAIRQLSQAFQSGVLRGDEFNTMAEAAPVLMDALAQSMGKPRSELRALAEDGKLTVDKLINAFSNPDITAGIDAQFAKTIPTISQRITLLENKAIEAIGRFDELTGTTRVLGAGIEFLANNMDTLIKVGALAATIYGLRFAAGLAIATRNAIGLRVASIGLAASLNGTAAAGSLAGRALLGAFGGPIGAAITGLSIVMGGLALETANTRQRLDEANGSLADSVQSLKQAEERAHAAGVQTEFVGVAASFTQQQFSVLPAILGLVATRFGDVGNNAKYAAEQMLRTKITEASTEIADINKQLNFRNAPKYKASKSSFEYVVGAATRAIMGGIEDFTGQTQDKQDTLKARKSALENFKRELAIIQATPAAAFENAAPGLSNASGGGDRGRKGRTGSTGTNSAAQEARQLAAFAKQAEEQIAQLREQYDGTASDVAQVNQAQRTLNDLIKELEEKKPKNFATMIADAKALGPIIDASLRKPFDEILVDQERQIELGRLSKEGRIAEREELDLQYQIMQRLGVESEDQLATALTKRGVTASEYAQLFENLGVMRKLTEEEARRNAIIDDRLRIVQDVYQNIEDTIAELPTKGLDSIGNFFDELLSQSRRLFAKAITQDLFGDAFKDLQDEITGKKDLTDAQNLATESVTTFAQSILDTIKKMDALGNAAAGSANKLAGVTVANDNEAANADAASTIANELEILVEGRKARLNGDFDTLGRTFSKLFETFLGKDSQLAKDMGAFVGKAMKDAFVGQMASSVFGDVFGVKQSNLGAGIGGAIGGAIGTAVGGPLGQAIGSALGGIIGGTIGGAFKKAKVGTATLSFNSSTGELGNTIGGNNAGARDQASGLGDSVVSGLQRIADQLGATLTGTGSVSIGVRDGSIRVDPTGRGNTKKKKGAIDFGEDEAAAIKFAIQDAIKDGVLAGLRAGTQALIQGGKDIEVQLEKALRFESVFQQLREIDDPVGAAVEKVNKEFQGLIKIFKEAGASAVEYADLERLYQIKRTDAIEQANNQLLGSMRDYLFQLTAGQNSVLSPQLRYLNSRNELNALDAKRAAGQTVDFDQYRTVADAFLAASRDYQGSTTSYFSDLQRITTTVQDWLSSEQSRASQNLATLDFSGLTTAVNNQTTVQTSILNQINVGIAALNLQLTALNDNMPTSGFNANLGADTRYYQNY